MSCWACCHTDREFATVEFCVWSFGKNKIQKPECIHSTVELRVTVKTTRNLHNILLKLLYRFKRIFKLADISAAIYQGWASWRSGYHKRAGCQRWVSDYVAVSVGQWLPAKPWWPARKAHQSRSYHTVYEGNARRPKMWLQQDNCRPAKWETVSNLVITCMLVRQQLGLTGHFNAVWTALWLYRCTKSVPFFDMNTESRSSLHSDVINFGCVFTSVSWSDMY